MKKLLLILALILLGCATPEPIPSNLTNSDDRAVYATNECKKAIQINYLDTSFDAFYANGKFRSLGTSKQIFDFNKCLINLGMKI
jgi:hypothetical protein